MFRKRPKTGSGESTFRRRSLFILLTMGLSILAMALSFALVLWMTRGLGEKPPASAWTQQRAILLRGISNDLTKACNDYYDVVASREGAVVPDARNWIDRVFRRDIRFLEQRIEDNPMSDVTPYQGLRAAVHRCASMARYPEDRALRAGALRDAKHAIEAVDAYIKSIEMTRSAGALPVRIRFASGE